MTVGACGEIISIVRTRHPAPTPTRRVCEAAALLGALLDDLSLAPVPNELTVPWHCGSMISIVGPSGSGKSTLLRDIMAAAKDRGCVIITPPCKLPNKAAIDVVGGSLEEAMHRLARAGLGEMRAFLRPPRALSTGQRARLRIALALQRAERQRRMPVALMIDEFGSGLDAPSCAALGALIRRWLDEHRNTHDVRIVIASSDERAARSVGPGCRLMLDAAGRVTACGQCLAMRRHRVHVRPGTLADLEALAPLHYRAGRPATIVQVLVAHIRGQRAGVLTISMPVLNASWREHAWPGRFSSGCKARDMRRINRELRCISRVIVDPAYRSLGLARRLVKRYLSAPLTPCTEALAAMGHAAPFFESAGMTAYRALPAARNARLLDAFEHVGIEPWRLATPHLVVERLRAMERNRTTGWAAAFIERELRIWARQSRATVAGASQDVQSLLGTAARTINATPIAYAHTRH